MVKKNLDALVDEFAKHVVAQNEEILSPGGSARKGNMHAKRYIAAFEKLRAHGDEGREALARLFGHPRMDVRVAAAVFLLRYKTEEAKAILEEAAKGRGLVPLDAQQALLRWREGTWALDPVDE